MFIFCVGVVLKTGYVTMIRGVLFIFVFCFLKCDIGFSGRRFRIVFITIGVVAVFNFEVHSDVNIWQTVSFLALEVGETSSCGLCYQYGGGSVSKTSRSVFVLVTSMSMVVSLSGCQVLLFRT